MMLRLDTTATNLRRDKLLGLTVRPELVEACHELVEWGGRLSRSWFGKLTTNDLTSGCPGLSW